MNIKNKYLLLLFLICLSVVIRIVSLQQMFIENYYSTGIYPVISKMLKLLFGWLPFSIGDVVYGILIVGILVKIIKGVGKLFRKEYNYAYIKTKAYSLVITVLLVYITFNILWGFNYNRKGINYQLGIVKEKYSQDDLVMIDSILVLKVNESKHVLIEQNKKYPGTKETIQAVSKAYNDLSKKYSWLAYQPQSAKTSLWGWAGNYLGFIGYYNPFTGEAQLNTTVPQFVQPFTACHEVAHQLGYAKENEANFVGYLAAVSSGDTLLCYSAYLDMYLYSYSNLLFVDSAKAKYFSKLLLPEVKKDIQALRDFNKAHKSPLEPLSRWLYKKYLENNEQPSGLFSYDEVIGFLIDYHKKFGYI